MTEKILITDQDGNVLGYKNKMGPWGVSPTLIIWEGDQFILNVDNGHYVCSSDDKAAVIRYLKESENGSEEIGKHTGGWNEYINSKTSITLVEPIARNGKK